MIRIGLLLGVAGLAASLPSGAVLAQEGATVEISDIGGSAPRAPAAAGEAGVFLPVPGSPVRGSDDVSPYEVAADVQNNREFLIGAGALQVAGEAEGGSGFFAVQVGDRNEAAAAIVQSPGTAVAQVQRGDDNLSGVAALGGAQNQVGVSQAGDGLVSAVLLVNTVDATVIHNQGPASPYGGVVIINGVPGMTIILP